MARFDSEAELASFVIQYLESYRWDVYQEVALGPNSADIVATKGSIVWAIETKRAFGLSVLAQANHWTRYANRTSVAIPTAKWSDSRRFGEQVAKRFGIGILTVSNRARPPELYVSELVKPQTFRHDANQMRAVLCEEQKTFAPAGTATGKRWTPFQRTCTRVRHVLKDGPIELGTLIKVVDHHYASYQSARGSLKTLIEDGVIDGIEMRSEGKKLFVSLKTDKEKLCLS